jgi:hypothetical protein
MVSSIGAGVCGQHRGAAFTRLSPPTSGYLVLGSGCFAFVRRRCVMGLTPVITYFLTPETARKFASGRYSCVDLR